MFKKSFSFEGRIKRAEFAISYFVAAISINLCIQLIEEGTHSPFAYILIPILFWFGIAQSTKRCHDLGESGFYQIIPFYIFWLLFQKGKSGSNEYGENSKE